MTDQWVWKTGGIILTGWKRLFFFPPCHFDTIQDHGLLLPGFATTFVGHTILGKTPLDEWSARRSIRQYKRQTSMLPAGLQPTITASERPQTHAFDRAATGAGTTSVKKVKVKWSRYRPGVAQRVIRGIALLFHDRGTRRGWVVSSTPRPHFTPRKDPVPISQETGWAPGPVWKGGKSRPYRDSIPDRPARSQSLYRLSYPAHTTSVTPSNYEGKGITYEST